LYVWFHAVLSIPGYAVALLASLDDPDAIFLWPAFAHPDHDPFVERSSAIRDRNVKAFAQVTRQGVAEFRGAFWQQDQDTLDDFASLSNTRVGL
jgi:hypothetical protein